MVNGVPQQGDIITINLDPRKGHEQQGYWVIKAKIIAHNQFVELINLPKIKGKKQAFSVLFIRF